MDDLYIEPKRDTPKVEFKSSSGNLTIEGQSFPESSSDFFTPVIKWIEEFSEKENIDITLNFKLTYFNTSSSKAILDILDILDDQYADGKKPVINWYYEKDDEDIKESGEEFAEDIDFTFNILEKN